MKKIKILDIVLLIVKIFLALLILIPLVFCSYNLIGVLTEDLANVGNEDYHSGTLFYLFASHVILLGANAVLFVIGCICWLISKKNTSAPDRKKHATAFRWLMLAPIASQLVYTIISVVVLIIL